MHYSLYFLFFVLFLSCADNTVKILGTNPIYEIKNKNLERELKHLFETQASDFQGEDSLMYISIQRKPPFIHYYINYISCATSLENVPCLFFIKIGDQRIAVVYQNNSFIKMSKDYFWENLKENFPESYKNRNYIIFKLNEQSITWHLTFKDNICIKREKLIQ